MNESAVRRLVIFGGPGSGAVVANYAVRIGPEVEVLGYLNDFLPVGTLVSGLPVLGSFAAWTEQPEHVCFLAPLHKAKHMPARAAMIDALGVPEARWSRLIDPQTSIAADVTIGPGSHIGAFAHIQPDAEIGQHVGIRGGVFIGHDCRIGDHVFIGANAFFGGYCEVAEGVHIGPNAAVREKIKIGRYAVIGMGAVVVRDVAEFTIVAGNPAVPIGQMAGPADTLKAEV